MKKLTALFIVLLIVTGTVFAQEAEEPQAVPDGLSFGIGGQETFVPVKGVFEDTKDPAYSTGVGTSWGINVTVTAAEGRIGGEANIGRGTGYNKIEKANTLALINESYTNPIVTSGNVNVWSKPFGSDILLIKIGKYEHDDYRGTGAGAGFGDYIGGTGGEEDVFARLNSRGLNGGALFVTKPISALSLFAELSPGWDTGKFDVKAGDVYKKIQAGAAFDFSGIGLLRAQWIGATMEGTDPAKVNVAFKLTAVEGLTLDVGAKIPVPIVDDDNDKTYLGSFGIALAGAYTAGDFTIGLGAYGDLGDKTKFKSGDPDKGQSTFKLNLSPSYYVAGIDAKIGLDANFKATGASASGGKKAKDKETTFGVGGWISRALGKGFIKTGLGYYTTKTETPASDKTIGYLTWPIILNVSL
jgi:hypothetical protein